MSGIFSDDFAGRLKLQLVKNNFINKTFAEAIGKTDRTVLNYVNGKTKPDKETMQKIESVLGVTADYLMYGEQIPEREIRRNASGYYDPTAYAAIKACDDEENYDSGTKEVSKMGEFKKGDICDYRDARKRKKKCIVLSNDEYSMFTSIIVLSEKPQYKINIPVMVDDAYMYANLNVLSYGHYESMTLTGEKASENTMKKIDAAIMEYLGIGKSEDCVNCGYRKDYEEIEPLKNQLKEANYIFLELNEKLESTTKELEEARKANELIVSENMRMKQDNTPPDDEYEKAVKENMKLNETVISLKTERNLYRQLYEHTFEMLTERKVTA